MAFNSVPQQSVGDAWTAAEMNVYVRDNFEAGVPGIFTTKGDIAVATAAQVATRLAVGANDSILFADSAETPGVVWGKVGYAKGNDTGAQNYLHTSSSNYNYTKLTEFDAEFYDLNSGWADDRFTAPAPGFYLVTLATTFKKGAFSGYSNATIEANETTRFFIYKNGSLYSCITSYVYQSNGFGSTATAAGIIHPFHGMDVVYLSKGEYIEFYVWSNICINVGGVIEYTRVNAGGDDQVHHFSVSLLP